MNKEIEIPEGYEARIEGNKVIIEPKESEDKIVNAIRKALESKIEDLGNGVTKTACLAWLEKHKEPQNASASTMIPSCWSEPLGEQKPSEWSEQDKEDREYQEGSPGV